MGELMLKVTGADVSVRPFLREDIIPLVDYWTENSEEFWRQRGVDKAKLKSRDEFIGAYQKAFLEKGGVPTMVTILLRGKPVGMQSCAKSIEGEDRHSCSREYCI